MTSSIFTFETRRNLFSESVHYPVQWGPLKLSVIKLLAQHSVKLYHLINTMVTPQPLVLRWGIISTGQISTAFVKVCGLIVNMSVPSYHPFSAQDILLDPKTYGFLELDPYPRRL